VSELSIQDWEQRCLESQQRALQRRAMAEGLRRQRRFSFIIGLALFVIIALASLNVILFT